MFSFWHLVPIGSCLLGFSLLMYALYCCITDADQHAQELWSPKPYILLLIGGLLIASAPPLLWLPVLYAG